MNDAEKIRPDAEDFEFIRREYGTLHDDNNDEEVAYFYQLAQAAKLIRLYGPKAH